VGKVTLGTGNKRFAHSFGKILVGGALRWWGASSDTKTMMPGEETEGEPPKVAGCFKEKLVQGNKRKPKKTSWKEKQEWFCPFRVKKWFEKAGCLRWAGTARRKGVHQKHMGEVKPENQCQHQHVVAGRTKDPLQRDLCGGVRVHPGQC